MSFEKAKADLEEKGLGDHVIVLNESSATVAEAAHALGGRACQHRQNAVGWILLCYILQ